MILEAAVWLFDCWTAVKLTKLPATLTPFAWAPRSIVPVSTVLRIIMSLRLNLMQLKPLDWTQTALIRSLRELLFVRSVDKDHRNKRHSFPYKVPIKLIRLKWQRLIDLSWESGDATLTPVIRPDSAYIYAWDQSTRTGQIWVRDRRNPIGKYTIV